MRSAGAFERLPVRRAVKVFRLFHRSTATQIHSLSAVRTIEHTRKCVHLAHRRRSPFTLPYLLHSVEGLPVDDGFLRILEYEPVLLREFDTLFRLIRLLIGFEIHCTARVFHIFEYPRDGLMIPYLRAIPYLCGGRQSVFMEVHDGRIDAALGQYPCDLRRTVAFDTEGEYLPYRFRALLVNHPFLFIVRGFHIAERRVRCKVLARIAFRFHDRAYLLGTVFRIHLVQDIP